MPPAFVKTIEDLMLWEYAILISQVVLKEKNYGFITDRWKRLRSGLMTVGSIEKDLLFQIKQSANQCEYCQSSDDVQFDHIIPLSKGGPDTAVNQVLCCKRCNSSKGALDLYKWFGLENKDNIPLLVKSKYLKMMMEAHRKAGTLGRNDLDGDGKLTVLDLGYPFK